MFNSEEELTAALENGHLSESPPFEGKAFPSSASPNGNAEIAKDIAAMATDGGVIVYGIGEDKQHRLRVDSAFPLIGEAERISNIVRTNLSDPPTIRITAIEKGAKPGYGYLIVIVPESPRAPHMVQIKGEYRYYGRDATGNRILSEADVERLYERRAAWDRGVTELLESAIENRPLLPYEPEGHGLFYLVVRPLTTDDHVLDRVLGDDAPSSVLRECFSGEISMRVGGNWRRTAVGVQATQSTADVVADLEIQRNGTARLFWTVTAQGPNNVFLVRDKHLAVTTRDLLDGLGRFYARAELKCAVDLGAALQGARGACSSIAASRIEVVVKPILSSDDCRLSARTTVDALVEDAEQPARELLGPLLDELSQRAFDPFTS